MQEPRTKITEYRLQSKKQTKVNGYALLLVLGSWFLVLASCILAFFLRLRDLAWVQMGYDELISLKLALDVLQGQWPAYAAYSGSVANHPPVYVYVMALGYLISKDFLWIVAYHGLLDVLGVGLTFYAGARYFSARVGFIAALFYAVAPWPIEFARHTWLTPQPVFTALMLCGMLAITQSQNRISRWGVLALGWGFTGLIGSHLSGIYFLPVVILALWLGRRQWRWPSLGVAFAPLLIIALAYLNFDRSQDFKNLSALFNASGAADRLAQFDLDSLKFALWNTGGSHLSDITGERFGDWLAQVPNWLTWLDTVQVSMVLLAICVCAWLAFRQRSRQILLVLLTWLVPVALQLRHAIPLGPAYFIAHVPAAFLMLGIAFDADRLRHFKRFRLFVYVGVTLIVTWHVFTWLRFNDFVQRYDTSIGGYGTPANSAYQATLAARQAHAANPDAWVVFVSQAPPSPYNLQTVLADVLLADVPHRTLQPNDGLILHSTPLQYVIAPDALGFVDGIRERWQVAPLAQLQTNLRNTVPAQPNGYVFLNLPAASLPTSAPSAKFSNGIEVLSANITRQQNRIRVDLTLRVTQLPPANAQYQWFNHVLAITPNGERMLGQLDGAGVKTAIWRTDDVLRQSFDIPIPLDSPPPPYTLRLGSYLLNGPRIQVTLPSGQVDDKITLAIP